MGIEQCELAVGIHVDGGDRMGLPGVGEVIEAVLRKVEVLLPQLGVCAAAVRCGCADCRDGPAVQ